MAPAVGEGELAWLLWTAPARFPAPAEQVEGVDDDGTHAESRGSSKRRREEMPGELGFPIWAKIDGNGEELGPVLDVELL
jgi:hypothetical protein